MKVKGNVVGVMKLRKLSLLKLSVLFHITIQLMNLKFGLVRIYRIIMIYIGRHRIDDLQRRIAMQDYESADVDIRSPSPEPIYDPKTGLRMNTKE